MAVIRPLAGLRYDPAHVGDVGLVLAPPYDVISPAEQTALYGRSPQNVVRLILPREPDRGAASARTLRAWVESGVLVREPQPAIYLYSQQFSLPDGSTRRRDGIICRLRLEDFSRGIVRPHERTLPGPKADRLAILRATGANLSPIMGLYDRPGEPVRELVGAAALGPPVIDVSSWHQPSPTDTIATRPHSPTVTSSKGTRPRATSSPTSPTWRRRASSSCRRTAWCRGHSPSSRRCSRRASGSASPSSRCPPSGAVRRARSTVFSPTAASGCARVPKRRLAWPISLRPSARSTSPSCTVSCSGRSSASRPRASPSPTRTRRRPRPSPTAAPPRLSC
ncbi:MAG: DUF1015 domain-containing protein [Deltaproteobacteria bacterium]|nr:MAG: DUF1015 domain-containing protein [Deltaproteobacteria bacterium]